MRVEGNLRVEDEELHNELKKIKPWGDVKYKKFKGKIVFDVMFGLDGEVAVYCFNVSDIVEDFIYMNTILSTGRLINPGKRMQKY
nr:putative integron gene cassette protein [uncultured bacterium]